MTPFKLVREGPVVLQSELADELNSDHVASTVVCEPEPDFFVLTKKPRDRTYQRKRRAASISEGKRHSSPPFLLLTAHPSCRLRLTSVCGIAQSVRLYCKTIFVLQKKAKTPRPCLRSCQGSRMRYH